MRTFLTTGYPKKASMYTAAGNRNKSCTTRSRPRPERRRPRLARPCLTTPARPEGGRATSVPEAVPGTAATRGSPILALPQRVLGRGAAGEGGLHRRVDLRRGLRPVGAQLARPG